MCGTGGFCGICKNTFITSVFIYGFFHITLEMIQTILPVGIIIVGFISMGLYVIRIPPPEPEIVQTVIGKFLTEENESPSGYYMKTVAHRGAGLDAPENSLVAFDLCCKKGCNAVEFDVCLTADDVAVVFHDNTLERMTDLDQLVEQTNWDELQKVDISINHPFKERYAGTKIPTLQQTVEQLLKCGQHMFIDIKTSNGKIINIILDLFEQYPELHSRAVVTSFYANIIYYVRRANPKIVCSLAWRPYCFSYVSYSAVAGLGPRRANNFMTHYINCILDFLHEWFLPRITYNLLGLSIILLHKDVISPKVVADWQEKGVRVVAWTVNHPVEKQYFARSLKITYMTDTLTGENSVHQ